MKSEQVGSMSNMLELLIEARESVHRGGRFVSVVTELRVGFPLSVR